MNKKEVSNKHRCLIMIIIFGMLTAMLPDDIIQRQSDSKSLTNFLLDIFKQFYQCYTINSFNYCYFLKFVAAEL